MNQATRDAIVRVALGEVGTTENPPGSNRNPYAAEIAPWANGQAWCAWYVSWVFQHAGCPLPPIQLASGGFGYCPFAVTYARQHGQEVPFEQAQPGDIVLFDWDKDGTADHVGIAAARSLGTTVETVEGNTPPRYSGDQSNGDGVYRKTRFKSDVICVWRPDVTVPEQEDPMLGSKPAPWASVVGGATPHYRMVNIPMLGGYCLQGVSTDGSAGFAGVATSPPDDNGIMIVTVPLGPNNQDITGWDFDASGRYVVVTRTDGRTLEFDTGRTRPPVEATVPVKAVLAVVGDALVKASAA